MRGTTRVETMDRPARRAALAAFVLLAVSNAVAWSQPSTVEELDRADGSRIAGRLVGDARAGFRFAPADGGEPILLTPGRTIRREGPPASVESTPSPAGPPPFRLRAGDAARISGRIRSMTADQVRWRPAWQSVEIALPRGAVQQILQRPGEAIVLADGFESIDKSRWKVEGEPETDEQPHLEGDRGLRLPGDGASLKHELAEPMASGRLELAFYDDGTTATGRECTVEPVFQGPSGRMTIRIVLGWSEESLSVQSPGGPGLPVQRRARTPGWHRLTVRFDPGETEIAVDGRELAHGRETGGPLCALRLATHADATSSTGPAPSGRFDDLRLLRFTEPPPAHEVDPTQDEARLVVGDQIFGTIQSANAKGIVMDVEGRPIPLGWGEVAGLYLRRVPAQGVPVDGLLVRVEWQPAPGDRPDDYAEGALAAVSDDTIAIATPYAGTLAIPRASLRRLMVNGRGRRIVLDVSAHHLGDEFSQTRPLDPPQFEGLSLDRVAELPEVPDGPAELVLDVVGVLAQSGETSYAAQVRNGELRTYVVVNGRRIDYLNRHIKSADESLERVRIAILDGLLKPGKNTIRIELTGDKDPRPKYDDIGILQIAIEFPEAGAGGPH